MAIAKVTVEKGSDGVAVVTVDYPPVNAIGNEVQNGLYRTFTQLHADREVKAIVLRGANGKFCGGGDIRGFQKIQENGSTGETLLVPGYTLVNDIIEGGPKPVVAAIEGFALGGGLELAMACNARITVPKVQVGLVELQLGIIPGLGGTQRLPRLVGLQKAIDMLLASKTLNSDEALKVGLVDGVVAYTDLLAAARKWALDIYEGRYPWQQSLRRVDKIGSLPEAMDILKNARAKVKKTYANVSYPFILLDVIENGIVNGAVEGVKVEGKACQDLIKTPAAKALMHVFFSERSSSKIRGITDQGLTPHPIRKAAVVGGALMGSGIATALALSKIPVLIKEIDSKQLDAAIQRIHGNLKSRTVSGKITKEEANHAMGLVKGVLDYKEFYNVDIVIEAATENVPLKQKLFQELEQACPSHCILATNTSSIDLEIVGASIRSQERLIGAHFFSPAHVMRLLEIVRSNKTSVQILVDVLGLAKSLKKVPVVVKSSPGFAVNRVFFPYGMGAHFLADLGVDPYRIDSVIKGFGMPMGPFRMSDLGGLQTGTLVGKIWLQAYPERVYASPLMPLLYNDNRLGESAGKGYYNYYGTRKEQPAPELKKYLEESRRLAGLSSPYKVTNITDQEIVEMIFFPVINEACRVLDEKVVITSSDLDIASVLGMAFPAYRGGIVFWADHIGAEYVFNKLLEWSNLYGKFFKPSKPLEACATRKIPMAQIPLAGASRL
uniref:TSA: Wollemia nobilis Ref_Wollemi_Transcript_536_2735 transcribed RNA sequence n=1 Tax=Wollemia nobilis TaxID=56998 RepID=A0A0C9RZE1_9CONI